MMRVIQAVNTSKFDDINGKSCIDYWRSQRPYRDDSCCRATQKKAQGDDKIVGAHVIGYANGSPHVYITPILNSVNTSGSPFAFNVAEADLVQVPLQDERAILSDPDNKELLRRF